MINLTEKLKTLPQKPGVYLFKDRRGEVIYIGKAKNLKNRVKSPREAILTRAIADLDYTIVSSEVEALILENILIKQYKPRFNVRLRDDKDYQFIKLDYSFEIPQIYTVRKITPSLSPPVPSFDGIGGDAVGVAKYFGPYTSGLVVKNTLNLIRRIFRLCRNKKVGPRPCFAWHLKRCGGVCFGKISPAAYRESFKQIERFLKFEQKDMLRDLTAQMKKAAKHKHYEQAAIARDKIRALRHLWEQQKIVSPKNENQDYLGLYRSADKAIITLFLVRNGRLKSQENFTLEHENSREEEILEKFILQYYADASAIPKEIFIPAPLPNSKLIKQALARTKNANVEILVPERGKKKKLLALVGENAAMFYERELASFEKRMVNALPELQRLLKLPTLPKRIEGYDISNIQGRIPVGSMVVFADGRPKKSDYRKFKISRTVSAEGLPKADDFAMMREMLRRRLSHLTTHNPSLPPLILRGGTNKNVPSLRVREGQGELRDKEPWPTPDLIIIDGGKGQLNVAVSVLKEYNLSIPVIGLAKRLEAIFVPGQKNSIILPPNSPVLFLLQQIRDEAHRFAVTFHRARRGKIQIRSRLDEIPGVGSATRKKLIAHFGSTPAVKQAAEEEIAQIVGEKLAKKIKENL